MPSKKNFKKKQDRTLPRTRKDANQDKRLMRVERQVKTLQSTEELKYNDAVFNATISTSATFVLLNGLGLGTNQATRVGASIRMTSVQYKFCITSATTVLTPIRFRYMLVLDRQANGAVPTFAGDAFTGQIGILNNTVITSLPQSPIQYETIERFRILKDKTVVFNPQMTLQDANPATAVVATSKQHKGYHKLGVTVKYGDDTTGIASVNTNSLYMIFVADIASSVQILGGARIYFKDS